MALDSQQPIEKPMIVRASRLAITAIEGWISRQQHEENTTQGPHVNLLITAVTLQNFGCTIPGYEWIWWPGESYDHFFFWFPFLVAESCQWHRVIICYNWSPYIPSTKEEPLRLFILWTASTCFKHLQPIPLYRLYLLTTLIWDAIIQIF